MPYKNEHRPRLSIEISREHEKALSVLPYGTKKLLFDHILDQLIPLIAKHPMETLGAVVSQRLKVSEFFNIPSNE